MKKSGKVLLMKKLFVLVRKDLSTSQQAVQGGHAVAEFLLHGHFTNWSNGILIYLGVSGLFQLENWMLKLKALNVPFTIFREPDIENELTAIATDQGEELFKRLRLL